MMQPPEGRQGGPQPFPLSHTSPVSRVLTTEALPAQQKQSVQDDRLCRSEEPTDPVGRESVFQLCGPSTWVLYISEKEHMELK